VVEPVQAIWRHVFEPNVRDHAMSGKLDKATFEVWLSAARAQPAE